MQYSFEYDPDCKKEIKKLCRKNTVLQKALMKKIGQILEAPYHFKPLANPMQHRRRVHILKSFVLVYTIIEETNTVKFLGLTHHDEAY
jgi:toxin YoeB